MEIPTGWIIFNILASYPLSVNFYPSHIGSNGIWIWVFRITKNYEYTVDNTTNTFFIILLI